MVSSTQTAHNYRVKLGHLEVVVLARDDAGAIALARREFARQLPRFYDLIRVLEESRFELHKATSTTASRLFVSPISNRVVDDTAH